MVLAVIIVLAMAIAVTVLLYAALVAAGNMDDQEEDYWNGKNDENCRTCGDTICDDDASQE